MTTNELLTLAISGIALLSSVLSLYLQFIHQRTALVGRLLRMHTTEGKWESQLTYSLSNTGNREILLSDVEFLEAGGVPAVSDLPRLINFKTETATDKGKSGKSSLKEFKARSKPHHR